ncbi:MAG: FecR domain-containing protein [Phormidesmis sp.]
MPSSRQSSRQAQALTVAVNRWLELRSLTGQVLYQSATGERSAQVGLRLQAVGEGIRTLSNATAMLAIDAGTGFINVSENTSLKIQALTTSNGGGRITQLQVLSGQVHLEVPTFTNPDSRLEIQTPSGWSGVRGTEFGIAVKPDGSTGTATLSGAVETSAQNQNVVVEGGFQNLIFPGEPPTQPVPITDDTTLSLTTIDTDRELAYLSGYTDPFNLLSIEGVAQVLDREGRFAISMPLPDDAGVRAVVTTPLGKEQAYEIQLF